MRAICIHLMLAIGLTLPFPLKAQEAGKGRPSFEVEYGEDQTTDEEAREGVVVVTGTRDKRRLKDSPVITEVITAEEIDLSRAGSLTEVMQDYGLQYMQNDMGNYIRLQGMGEDKLLFLVNGRKISGRVSRRLDANTIPVGNIDRIEIIRGPQSALYGSEGIGGVINIITKKPTDELRGRVKISNGTPERVKKDEPFFQQNLSADMQGRIGQLYAGVYGDFARSEYLLDDDADASLAPRYVRGSGGVDLGISPTRKLNINAGGDFTTMTLDDRLTAYGTYTRKETDRANGYVEAQWTPSPGVELSSRVYHNHYERNKDKYLALTDTWENKDQKEREDLTSGELYAAMALSDSNRLTVGVEASRASVYKYNLEEGKKTDSMMKQALVLQDEQYARGKYSIIAGVRLERDDAYGGFVSPKVSAMYHFTRAIRVLGGVGVGYRAPDFSDLYLVKDEPTHPVIIGNDSLRPEKSVGSNAGIELTGKTGWARLNIFHNELWDEIVNVLQNYQDNGRDVYIKDNIGRTTRSGADCELGIDFLTYLNLSAGYGFIYAYDRSAHDELRDQPRHTIRGKLGFDLPSAGLNSHLRLRYQSAVPDGDLEESTMLDFFISKRFFGHLRFFAAVENITDYIDESAGFAKGRYYILGTEASF